MSPFEPIWASFEGDSQVVLEYAHPCAEAPAGRYRLCSGVDQGHQRVAFGEEAAWQFAAALHGHLRAQELARRAESTQETEND